VFNWIGVSIDSAGGDLEDCLNVANVLAELDPTEVQNRRLMLPVEASGGAALVALACDQLVMHPKRTWAAGHNRNGPQMLEAAREQIKNSPGKNVAHSGR